MHTPDDIVTSSSLYMRGVSFIVCELCKRSNVSLRIVCSQVLQLLLLLLNMIGNSHTAAKRYMLFTLTAQREATLGQHVNNEVCMHTSTKHCCNCSSACADAIWCTAITLSSLTAAPQAHESDSHILLIQLLEAHLSAAED
jgi:hypothetical protein